MTKTEVAQLLTLISAFDKRTVGQGDVEAWHLIVKDLEPDDCAAAVEHHYKTSRDWLMPADVRSFALAAARTRAGQAARAKIDAEIAAENPTAELRERPVAALTVGRTIPVGDPERVERRAALRAAAHTTRDRIDAEVEAANEHQERLAAAKAELAGR